jgi:hypothetical protein
MAGGSGLKKRAVVLPLLDELTIGILAGAFAKLFTTPLGNIVTRKQTAALYGDYRPHPFLRQRRSRPRSIRREGYRGSGLTIAHPLS